MSDAPLTTRQASLLLTMVWLELLDRKKGLSDEAIILLGMHFAPDFKVERGEEGRMEYRLHAPFFVGEAEAPLIHMAVPDPASHRDMRINMKSEAFRAFVADARESVRVALEQEFPVLRPEQIKTSFAYEADRLIREGNTNEDHDPSGD